MGAETKLSLFEEEGLWGLTSLFVNHLYPSVNHPEPEILDLSWYRDEVLPCK